MGRKRSSNDADFVQPDQYIIPKNKKAKILPPEPWPLPEFDVNNAWPEVTKLFNI